MKTIRMLPAAALAVGFLASPIQALEVTTATQLTLRSGPGLDHPILQEIEPGMSLVIGACVARSQWCQVSHGESGGWAAIDLWQRPRFALSTSSVPGPRWRKVDRIRLRPDPEATQEEIDRALDGGRIEATTASGDLIVIPEEAVAVYMTAKATGPVRREGQLVIDDGSRGVIFYRVPGTGENFLLVNGKVRRLAPGTRVKVYVNR